MDSGKRFRWVCPRCGEGRLASSRPRLRATVRFCLSCSAKSEDLVERICPTLERERQAKEDARRAKRTRAAQAKKKQKIAVAERKAAHRAARNNAMLEQVGDLQAELRRLWPLACELSLRNDLDPSVIPPLRWRQRDGDWVGGVAYYDRTRGIAMTVGRDADTAAAYGTLAHEVTHLVALNGEGHGPGFWMLLTSLCEVAYDASPDLSKQTTKYGRQLVVEQAIREARARLGL